MEAAHATSSMRAADFFLLSVQWGQSYCSVEHCVFQPKQDFTIHGLWPNYDYDPPPEDCPGPSYNPTAIADLRDELESRWPSLTGAGDEFWSHEWTKHGTCASPFLNDEHAYFSAGLRLFESAQLLAALESAGITPDDERTYETAAVSHAIGQALGTAPALECAAAPASAVAGAPPAQGAPLLMEVRICVDPSSLTFEQCPASPRAPSAGSQIRSTAAAAIGVDRLQLDTLTEEGTSAACGSHVRLLRTRAARGGGEGAGAASASGAGPDRGEAAALLSSAVVGRAAGGAVFTE